MRALSMLTAAFTVAPALTFAQLDITRFMPEARPVRVDVLVRTKAGPVAGLTKDDFVLKDKGKVQKIELFAATPAHDANDKPAPLAPGVGSNRLNWRGEPVRSATVILFDRINTPPANQAFARQQVLALLASLKETDAVAFISLHRTFSMVHDFTNDPAPLIRAAQRIASGSPVEGASSDAALQRNLETSLMAAQELDQTARPVLTAGAFRFIATHLGGLPGRKNLVWITQSFPLTFGSDIYRRNETANELAMTTTVLQEANVAVYPVSPGGAGSGFNDTSTRNDRPTEGTLMPGSNAATRAIGGAIGDGTNMQMVADATGGRAYYNINELIPSIRAVLDDTELSYTLGFFPDAKARDDKMHGLDIDLVKGKGQGAVIQFRQKYFAAKGDLPAMSLPQLAAAPLDATSIGLAGVSQPDPAKPGSQRVDVSVNPGDLTLKRQGDKWTGGFEMGLFVEGAPINTGTVKTFNLSLTDEQYKQVLAAGMLVNGSVPSKGAGDAIRVVVLERASGAAGSMRVPAR